MNNRSIKRLIELESYLWKKDDKSALSQLFDEIFHENLIVSTPLVGNTIGKSKLLADYSIWIDKCVGGEVDLEFNAINNCVSMQWTTRDALCIAKPNEKFSYVGRAMYQFHSDKVVNYMSCLDLKDINNRLGFLHPEGEIVTPSNYDILMNQIKKINGYSQLTKKEIEILSFVTSGCSAKEIANIFKISSRTVESHLDHIKSKLNCCSKRSIRDLIYVNDVFHLFQNLYLLLRKGISI